MFPMRILHVMETAEPAGAAIARMVASLAESAASTRYLIGACFFRPGKLMREFEQLGIRSTCVDWSGRASDLRGVARFAGFLRSSGCNIIHQHTGGRVPTKIVRLVSSARIVRHLHGRASETTGRLAEHPPSLDYDALIVVSNAVAEFSGDPRAVVIHPGVDVSQFSGLRRKHSEVVLGTACRLELIKDVRCLIEAFALLASEFPDVRLEIAGDGSLRPTLEQQCRELELPGRVSFLGWRDDLPTVMGGWDVFILPSLDEGFPVAALEAMAAGLPVVASAVGGLCEMVVQDQTGLLVPPSAPVELAAPIRELICDREKRDRMGAAGRKHVRANFSEAQMVDRIFKVYDGLLS